MRQPDSGSPEAHGARVLRGITAVLGFLRGRFPQSVVEVFPKNSHDVERNTRTFEVRNGDARVLVRVTDEVFDLDFEGATRLLRQLQVAHAVRVAPTEAVVVVTTRDVIVEPA